MNPRITKKERGLLKGAMRRVFSRSELRRAVVAAATIQHHDASRPRVKKWGRCAECRQPTPLYLLEVDHVAPIVPVDTTLDAMSWDTLVDNLWCQEHGLRAVCKPCHKTKSKIENAERRKHKKGLKK